MDVEAIRIGGSGLLLGDQRRAACFGNELQDRIFVILRRVAEINARDKALQESGAHDSERDMRRLERVPGSRHAPGLYRPEAKAARRVRRAAAETDKGRIE